MNRFYRYFSWKPSKTNLDNAEQFRQRYLDSEIIDVKRVNRDGEYFTRITAEKTFNFRNQIALVYSETGKDSRNFEFRLWQVSEQPLKLDEFELRIKAAQIFGAQFNAGIADSAKVIKSGEWGIELDSRVDDTQTSGWQWIILIDGSEYAKGRES